MALISIETRSPFLGKATSLKIIMNEKVKPPYPTYYLLHGLSDDCTTWARNTRLERYATQYPFMFVMLDGARSFYCDSPIGRYETAIIKDIIPFIETTFPVRKQRRFRAIGGLSMGGYGSLKLGLKFRNIFGAIAAHSSAVDFAHGWEKDENGKIKKASDWEQVTGNIPEIPVMMQTIKPEENDIYELAVKGAKSKLPDIYFDCGTDDFLHNDNVKFHKHLKKNGIAHTYKEFPGEHNWEYWDEHIQDAMKFVAKAMGL